MRDEDLDRYVLGVLSSTPNAGESYIQGSIRGWALRIQRWRIRRRLQLLDPVGRAVRQRRVIRR